MESNLNIKKTDTPKLNVETVSSAVFGKDDGAGGGSGESIKNIHKTLSKLSGHVRKALVRIKALEGKFSEVETKLVTNTEKIEIFMNEIYNNPKMHLDESSRRRSWLCCFPRRSLHCICAQSERHSRGDREAVADFRRRSARVQLQSAPRELRRHLGLSRRGWEGRYEGGSEGQHVGCQGARTSGEQARERGEGGWEGG